MMQAIRVENISKKYFLRKEAHRTLKSTLLSIVKQQQVLQDFWALKGLNITVENGETFGIIGANGAGKSTLLGIIANTIRPTEGKVTVNGRISSLLELGAGFHPDLTGRENIYLNGSILGLSKKYIDGKFDDIVAFAGLSDFIDTPVKYYSSGMYVRLGFSVAVETDPDILLVDEVLAVGDESFRRKCLRKIADFHQAGKTIVVVSHDLDTVRKICDRVMLLAEGKTIEIGDPTRIVEEYSRLGPQEHDVLNPREWGTKEAMITGVEFFDNEGVKTDKFKSGGEIIAKVSYDASRRIDDPIFGFSVNDYQGRLCAGSNTINGNFHIDHIEGRGKIILTLGPINLTRGKFYLSFSLHSRDHETNYHRLDNKYAVWISSRIDDEGTVVLPSRWSTK
jgi:ABC-type polysaccharide/polyol phosphate transport system ATPase subunit